MVNRLSDSRNAGLWGRFQRTCSHALFVVIALLLAVLPALAEVPSSIPREATWVTNGEVYNITVDNETTYIVGNFTYVGPNTGSFVPIDATTGRPTGNFPRVDGVVHTSASDGVGGWYIGGKFSAVGGFPRNCIAHIRSDGTVNPVWDPNPSPRSDGTQPEVEALVVSGSTVYVGGSFNFIGGQMRSHIAALDASTGLATAWNPSANNKVITLAVSNSTVYAGGYFTSIGSRSRRRIAALDATTGTATAWNPSANNDVLTLDISGSTIYAGGNFTSIGGQSRNRVAAIEASTGLATEWNPNADNRVYALAVSKSTVYVGGNFTSIGGEARNCIAAIDVTTGSATAWNPNASGTNRIIYTLAVSGSTLYVGGNFTSIGGQLLGNLAALDVTTGLATEWNPNAGNSVRSLAVSGSKVYAGCESGTIGGLSRRYIAALDSKTGVPTTWNPNANGVVSVLVLSGSTAYVAGGFTSIGGEIRNYIATLDTTTGLATPWNPNANKGIGALALSGSTVYVAGGFTSIGGQTRNSIAAIEASTGLATAWNPDPNNEVIALAVSGSTIIVGGRFNHIGGENRSAIAALDVSEGRATAWNPDARGADRGDGFPYMPSIQRIVLSGSMVVAIGFFHSIAQGGGGDCAAIDISNGLLIEGEPKGGGYLVVFNGSKTYSVRSLRNTNGYSYSQMVALDSMSGIASNWNPSADYYVGALAFSGPSIYAGGRFTNISGQSRSRFAQFDSPNVPANPSAARADAIGTNTLTWRWEADSEEDVSFKLYADNAYNGAPILLQTTSTEKQWMHSGLIPNTPYSMSVHAINSFGASNNAADATTWTLAAAPIAPVVIIPSESIVRVAIAQADNNPTRTEYAIFHGNTSSWVQADGSLGVLPAWQTRAAWGTKTVVGLTADEEQSFAVRARNGARVETANSPFANATTNQLFGHPSWILE